MKLVRITQYALSFLQGIVEDCRLMTRPSYGFSSDDGYTKTPNMALPRPSNPSRKKT